MIQARNVTKRYGKTKDVISNLSLEIRRGEMLGLKGENGAGKSTLLSMLALILPATAGEIWIDGKEIRGDKEAAQIKKKIGYVPQEIALYGNLSVKDNLSFWGKAYGLRGSSLRTRIDEVLAFVGLKNRQNDRIETFSGGMKRKVNLAASILHSPELLILDEPTAGVDRDSRRHILQAIKEMSENGCTVILTSHQEDEMMYCDRVALLEDGKIASFETPQNNRP
ncbi:ABC-type multidrug transport system ATPase subunit [Ammoniphilus resinae]|uniref:ABC-type multidrug transport system ATPase subunit n=1 Tax=Ammoniphilus resinae TaxID=861532 RepID=A0ABS4GPL4_9BACL|nr:ABC-type multidrug transport system ATPase subunit [Ammoniphilus resinae]